MSNPRMEKPVEHIGSMVGGLQTTVKQLESVSRLMANIATAAGTDRAIEGADISHAMGLFTLHLAAIRDGLDDVLNSVEAAMARPLEAVNR